MRIIRDPIHENGIWRKLHNCELRVEINKYVRLNRLKWAGFVIRKESIEISKKSVSAMIR